MTPRTSASASSIPALGRFVVPATVMVGASEQGIEWQTKQIHSDWEHMAERRGETHVAIMPDNDGAPTRIDLQPTDAAPA